MGGYLSRMPFPPPPPTILSCNFQPPTPSRFLYDPWWQWQLLLSQNFMPNKHFSKNIQLMKSPALNDKELTKLSHPASAAITWCWSKLISIQLLWLRLPTILVLCCCVVTLIWLHCVLYWTWGRRRMFWLRLIIDTQRGGGQVDKRIVKWSHCAIISTQHIVGK